MIVAPYKAPGQPGGESTPHGELQIKVIRGPNSTQDTEKKPSTIRDLAERFRSLFAPQVSGQPLWLWKLRNKTRPLYIKGWFAKTAVAPVASWFGLTVAIAELRAVLHRADGSIVDLGVLGYRVVTNAAVEFITDQMQTSSGQIANFDYHDAGTGVGSESASDTALGTPYGGARTNGTPGEGASANIYSNAGTIAFSSTFAITEHGLFNASTAGTLLDRTKFSAVNVQNGDSIAFTYQITWTAGS